MKAQWMKSGAMFFFGVFSIALSAQQETYFTHSAFNRSLLNPAFAGNLGNYEFNSVHHRQWLNLRDQTGRFRTEDHQPVNEHFPTLVAPVTSAVGFTAPIAKCTSHGKKELGGFGFSAMSDVIGYEKNTSIKSCLAFAIQLSRGSNIRVGFDLNYLTKSINSSLLRAHQNPDPLIPVGTNPTDSKLVLGSGLVYQNTNWNSLYMGISVSGINRPSFTYYNYLSQPIQIQTAKHATFFAGAEIPVKNKPWMANPFLLVRSVNTGHGWVLPQIEGQTIVEFRRKFATGAGFRFQANGADAAYLMLGFYPSRFSKNGRLRIGYSYDITLQSLKYASRNTHELQLNYTFQRPCKDKPEIGHPRDLEFNRKDWI